MIENNNMSTEDFIKQHKKANDIDNSTRQDDDADDLESSILAVDLGGKNQLPKTEEKQQTVNNADIVESDSAIEADVVQKTNDNHFDEHEAILIDENKNKRKQKILSEEELKKAKAKNVLKIIAFVLVIAILAFIVTLFVRTLIHQNSLQDRKVIKEEEKIVKIGSEQEDFWRKKMEIEIKDQKKDQEEFKEEVKDTISESSIQTNTILQGVVESVEERLDETNKNIDGKFGEIGASLEKLNEKLTQDKADTDNKILKLKEEIKSEIKPKMPVVLPTPIQPQAKPIIKKEVVYEDSEILEPEVIKSEQNTPPSKPDKESVAIPSGYIQIITHTSIKGPTGSKAQSETHPVRMEIIGFLEAANGDKTKLDGCYVRGAAKGDITTLRNHINLTRLYCVGEDKNGKYKIEAKIDGQVYDELDGGLGFPGVLVDSAGKILTRELSMAVIQGAAQMASSSKNIIVPNTGTFSSADTTFGQEFSTGAASGFGKGLEGITNYWRDILKGYYPFIDSKAARVGKAFLELNDQEKLEKIYFEKFELNNVQSKEQDWKLIIK